MGGIAFSVSAFQQTYGVSVHSLVFLSSQEAKLRSSIKKSAFDEAKLLVSLGTPRLEQEIERRVLSSAQKEEEDLIQKTGVVPSLTQGEMKVSNVLSQITLLHGYEDIVRKS